jgi:glyoxylase-like metal-dependent hydrolase (beta-lactamase superfamily II)
MADAPPPLVFDTSFAPEPMTLVQVMPGVGRITAPNGGPFTFTGTNTFIIGEGDRVGLLDPGPLQTSHLEALRTAIGGRKVEAILLTHTHNDHSASAAQWAKDTGAPLWFAGPHRLSRPLHPFEINALARECDWGLTPHRTLLDGEVFEVGGVRLNAIATPGHCANHLCFGIEGTEWLLSGDHIMGWNSTLVAVPDGSMADYLSSLRKVIALPYAHYIPAHGGPIVDGPAYARALLAHRELRNRQVVAAVNNGATRVSELLAKIYPTLASKLKFAAGLTLMAHIEYLDAIGEIRMRRGVFGVRLARV